MTNWLIGFLCGAAAILLTVPYVDTKATKQGILKTVGEYGYEVVDFVYDECNKNSLSLGECRDEYRIKLETTLKAIEGKSEDER